VFKNGVLRRLFGFKREEMAGGWRRLDNEGFINFYASPNIINVIESKRMRWVGQVVHKKETKKAYKILVVESEWKRTRKI
jgi:hypothetical protein